jgi:hypothetical protein
MLNHRDTVASQYANSPTILQLIDSMNGYIDPRANMQAFYDYVWNVETAQGFGLDVWGKIVRIGRNFVVSESVDAFGFVESRDAEPFNQAPFFSSISTSTVTLDDTAYRKLIMIKALANISAVNAASLNILLRQLFGGRRCYVLDLGAMQMRYVFEFALTPLEYALLTQSNAMPRPAGVAVSVLQLDVSTTFGFKDSGLQPFGSGVFSSPPTLF